MGKDEIISFLTNQRIPIDKAIFICNTLRGIFSPKSSQRKETDYGIERYVQGNKYDKVSIFLPDLAGEPTICDYSRNYDIEGSLFRVICSFKDVNSVFIIIGYGEKLEKEMIIRILSTDNSEVRLVIERYSDLSPYKEQKMGVTKNDIVFLHYNEIEPTEVLESTIVSEEVVSFIRRILVDPRKVLNLSTENLDLAESRPNDSLKLQRVQSE